MDQGMVAGVMAIGGLLLEWLLTNGVKEQSLRLPLCYMD